MEDPFKFWRIRSRFSRLFQVFEDHFSLFLNHTLVICRQIRAWENILAMDTDVQILGVMQSFDSMLDMGYWLQKKYRDIEHHTSVGNVL